MEKTIEYFIREGILIRIPDPILQTHGEIRLGGNITALVHWNHSLLFDHRVYRTNDYVYFFLVESEQLGIAMTENNFPGVTAVNVTRVKPRIRAIGDVPVRLQPCGTFSTIKAPAVLAAMAPGGGGGGGGGAKKGVRFRSYLINDAGQLSILRHNSAAGMPVIPGPPPKKLSVFDRAEGGALGTMANPLQPGRQLPYSDFKDKDPHYEWVVS